MVHFKLSSLDVTLKQIMQNTILDVRIRFLIMRFSTNQQSRLDYVNALVIGKRQRQSKILDLVYIVFF